MCFPLEAVQCLLCHFVLNKRKVLLDQLRQGLKTLGGLEEMEASPMLFERFFVFLESTMTSYNIKDVLTFPNGDTHKDVKDIVIRFIYESNNSGMYNEKIVSNRFFRISSFAFIA